MEFLWNRKKTSKSIGKRLLFHGILVLISIFLTSRVVIWMSRLESSSGLIVLVSLIVLLASYFGLWLLYEYIRLFSRRKEEGMQLRGKISLYFLLISLGTIVVVGGLLTYLIFLIEDSVNTERQPVTEEIIEEYETMVRLTKARFEKSIYVLIDDTPEEFSDIFSVSNNEVVFLKSSTEEWSEYIKSNFESIYSFYSDESPGVFYVGNGLNFLVFEREGFFYTYAVTKQLAGAIELLNEQRNSYNRYTQLSKNIKPIAFASLFIFSVPVLLAAFFLSLVIARSITSGIEKVVEGTRLIASGNLEHRVDISSGDELETLGKNFNQMANRLQRASEQGQRIERLEAWHEVAKRLAHEIKNPLTPIKLSTERLVYAFEFKKEKFPEILDKTTKTIVSETKRLETLVNEFSSFARLPQLKLETHDIIATLNEVVDFFRGAYSEAQIIADLEFEKFETDYDENQLKQVLINLIGNAIEASPESGQFVKLSTTTYGNTIQISIEDKAGGIPPEIGMKIFTPYFTTKEKGTGLGLAIAERIIVEHNGNIWHEATEEGTIFSIELPISKGGPL